MKNIIKLSFFVSLLLVSTLAVAQEDINNEVFKPHFAKTASGASLIFNGKSHSFSLNIAGPSVKEEKVKDKGENMMFIAIGKDIVQTSLVPLPKPIPKSMMLSKLTEDQIKNTLEGYVNYELEYFEKDLKVNSSNVKKEWKTINSRLYLIWYFEFKADAGTEAATTFSAQIYYSTVCFNQILDINMPLYSKGEVESKKALLEKIAATLKSYDKRLPL